MNRIKALAKISNLEIGVDVNDRIYLHFRGSYVVEPYVLIGVSGRGDTVEEAAEDYYERIRGKKIRIYSFGKTDSFREFYIA